MAAFGRSGSTVVLRGTRATELALREAVAGAAVVHLATHGFCGLGGDGALLSGVALAGANAAVSPAGDDGILTADEAAFLDLRSCRLVALSACQTGLGKPFAGESLLGLRRALHAAGARCTLTSLWRVDDAATRALMADFYRAFGQERTRPAAALRAAQLAALQRARLAHGTGLPGLWGAFVVEGG